MLAEHGAAPDDGVRRWQDRMTLYWKIIGDGCRLNRSIHSMGETSGFRIEDGWQGYMKDARFPRYFYYGEAVPR